MKKKILIMAFFAVWGGAFAQQAAGSPTDDFIRDRLYGCVLERDNPPGAEEVAFWRDEIVTIRMSFSNVYRNFFQSREYISQIVRDDHFVKQLYQCVLGRPADSVGLAGWLNFISAGASRAEVLDGFLMAREFREFVLPVLENMAHREARLNFVSPHTWRHGAQPFSMGVFGANFDQGATVAVFLDGAAVAEFPGGFVAPSELWIVFDSSRVPDAAVYEIAVRNSDGALSNRRIIRATHPWDALFPAPGSFIGSGFSSVGTTFSSYEKVSMAPFFYWYDMITSAHLIGAGGGDALTTHPASFTNPDFSMMSLDWWKKELRDMSAAGVDIILPVYWGFADAGHTENWWSNGGLTFLVQALRELEAEGVTVPKVGMFYDTSTLENNPLRRKLNLSDAADRLYAWGSIRDFWSLIPPQYWAQIDGKPIIVLYTSFFAAGYDQYFFDFFLRDQFWSAFGSKTPYIIREQSWNVVTENDYTWGAALHGPQIYGVTSIGPGYDDAAAVSPVRPAHHVRSRDGGAYYNASWQEAIGSGRNIILLESWNEFHEGSDIAESREFGRQYIWLSNYWTNRRQGRLNDAVLVGQSIPESMMAGAKRVITVTFRNTGLTTWTRGAGFRLGTQVPQDNTVWGVQRVELFGIDAVHPKDEYTFFVEITAPAVPGIYALQWKMLQEAAEWFGVSTELVMISVQ